MGKTKGHIRVAIIDSGVRKEHPLFAGEDISGFQITEKGIEEEFSDTYGHGTAIYAILSAAKLPVDILNVKLEGIEEGADEELLCRALEYIADNITVDIINLSLGLNVVNNLPRLYSVCKCLHDKDVLLISAFDNAGSYSYPALFDCVIGVTTGELCANKGDFEYFEDEAVNIGAMGGVQKLAWCSPDYIINGGNSFACAHVTVQCVKYMLEGLYTRQEILEQFRRAAKRVFQVNKVRKQGGIKIKKAILFPFNKEMHSLIRFSHLLDFELTDVYDVKYSGLVGSDTAHLLKDDRVLKKKIRCIDEIEWDSFDTLILGHIDTLAGRTGKAGLRSEIINKMLEHHKQIYSFDELCEEELPKDSVFRAMVDWPEVRMEDVPANPQGKLYRIGKPVLGVFGTSSKQGKFTLQLTLRERLERRGICIGQIGTEPSALLYGMDAVYPMGYNGSVHITDTDAVRYLNFKMHQLCEKECQLILVGSQSGTVPYDVGNIGQYNLSQYFFLQGTLPDAALLCINSYDDIEHVKRTVQFLQAATETEVIALVVYPMELRSEQTGIYGGLKELSEASYQKLRQEYEAACSLPVMRLGQEQDMEKVTDLVISYFSE